MRRRTTLMTSAPLITIILPQSLRAKLNVSEARVDIEKSNKDRFSDEFASLNTEGAVKTFSIETRRVIRNTNSMT